MTSVSVSYSREIIEHTTGLSYPSIRVTGPKHEITTPNLKRIIEISLEMDKAIALLTEAQRSAGTAEFTQAPPELGEAARKLSEFRRTTGLFWEAV